MAGLGELKQRLQIINNKTNIELFNNGLEWQKIEFFDNIIVIVAKNKRVPALRSLDIKDKATTRLIDLALLEQYKNRLKELLIEELGLKPIVIFKDYDPESEISVTVIIEEFQK